MSLKKLKIAYPLFFLAFFEDNYRLNTEEAYLCKKTGKIIFVKDYEDESAFVDDADFELSAQEIEDLKENDIKTEEIETNPDRYLLIPKTSYSVHHDILREFLSSIKNGGRFSDLEINDATVADYYNERELIGYWLKQVSVEMGDAYKNFKNNYNLRQAEKWLRENGIEVKWTSGSN